MGCSTCHLLDQQGRCPNLRGVYGSRVQLAGWWHCCGRRRLHPRVDPESQCQDRSRLPAGHHAHLPGPDQRGRNFAVDRLHQVSRNSGRAQRRRSSRMQVNNEHSFTRSTHYRKAELPKHRIRLEIVAVHQRPQTHRRTLSHLHHRDVRHRGDICAADPPRAAHAARRHGEFRHLQQVLHHARRGDGVLLSHTIDPGDAGKFLRAHDDRRQRPGLPAHQSVELVYLHRRSWLRAGRHHSGRRRYRLDLLYAV